MPGTKPQPQLKASLRSSTSSESPGPKKVVNPTDTQVEKGKISKMHETEGATVTAVSSAEIIESPVETMTVREEIKVLFEKMDRKMSKQFREMETKFSDFFDNFREELLALKTDMGESKEKLTSLSSKVLEIENSLEFQSKEQKDHEKKQDEKLDKVEKDLDKKIKDLDAKLMLLEKHDRKYNLLFYGIKEDHNENIYEKVRELFLTDLEMEEEKVQSMYFAHAHRLPSNSREGPRPLIVRFTSFEERESVLAHAPKLAGTRRRIVSDLPVPMKKERARLAKQAYDIRKKEGLQTRIKDKGLEVYLEIGRAHV